MQQIILLFIFLLSRVFFINSSLVFFDAPEYVRRLSSPSYLEALTSGHFPLHSGYFLLFWPIYRLANLFGLNPISTVIYVQQLIALCAVISFYKTIRILTNKEIAFKSIIIASLIPLYWIVNEVIMIETTYCSLFLIGYFFLVKYFKRRKTVLLFLSGLFIGISIITLKVILLWIPLLIYTIYARGNREVKIILLFLTICLLPTLFEGYLMSYQQNSHVLNGTISFYTTHTGDWPLFNHSPTYILILIRNAFIPFMQNNTSLLVILLLPSYYVLLQKKYKKIFVFATLWILPFLLANQWWDSLLIGRYSILASFGLAFSIAIFFEKKDRYFTLLIAYMIVATIPSLALLRKPIPYIQEAETIARLPKESLVIESHFARPQVEIGRRKDIIFIDGVGTQVFLQNKIEERLSKGEKVFITGQAISEPYGLYSGPYLHGLSLSYRHPYLLSDTLKHFSLKKYTEIDNQDNLVIFSIETSFKSAYPKVPSLKQSFRRLDYFDPLAHAWRILDDKLFSSKIDR